MLHSSNDLFRLISLKFRFIPFAIISSAFFFTLFHRQCSNRIYAYLRNTRNGKEEFLARQQLRSLPFYIVAIWISVTSANPASKSSPFVPALQRAFTGRQCGNQHCCSIDSRMNVNMHILVEYSYVIKRRLILLYRKRRDS